jgi:signal transduction histidine kinase
MCLGVADTVARLSPPSGTAPARTALVPVLVVTAALSLRRVAPLGTVLVVVTAIVLPAMVAHVRLVYWGELVPWLVALYSVGRHDTRRHAATGLLVSVVGFGALTVRYPDLREPGNALYDIGLMAVATTIGAVVRQRAALVRENVRLDEDRRLAVERATSAERSRIARELHDVVSHGISVIVLQAGGARLGLDRDPEAAREALRRIELAGRQSLAELRVMLEVLRCDELGDDRAIAPAPTLRRLEELVEEHRRLGLDVRLDSPAEVFEVPLAVQLSAYRIVQEGLTNVLKHAGPVPTTVTLRLSDVLDIDICNAQGTTGPTQVPSGGFGLVGLGERVAVLGGRLRSGSTPGGGFRLCAEIPVRLETA